MGGYSSEYAVSIKSGEVVYENLKKEINLNLFKIYITKNEWYYLNEKNANEGPLHIPTGLWHGCYNYTNEPAILIYHITEKYDGTDEERMDPKLAMWEYEREDK